MPLLMVYAMWALQQHNDTDVRGRLDRTVSNTNVQMQKRVRLQTVDK